MTHNELGMRIAIVKGMHKVMCTANDENAYMTWIYTMPDEPTEEDFEWFAFEDAEFKGLVKLFMRLVHEYGFDNFDFLI